MPAAGSGFAAMRTGESERTRDGSTVSGNERPSAGACTTASRLGAKDADVTIAAGSGIELDWDGRIRPPDIRDPASYYGGNNHSSTRPKRLPHARSLCWPPSI